MHLFNLLSKRPPIHNGRAYIVLFPKRGSKLPWIWLDVYGYGNHYNLKKVKCVVTGKEN